jgi:hypothetical protein
MPLAPAGTPYKLGSPELGLMRAKNTKRREKPPTRKLEGILVYLKMKTSTQKKKILAHLEKGKTITSLTAFKKFGCTRLAARVLDLRRDGHPVKSERISVNGKHVSKYSI